MFSACKDRLDELKERENYLDASVKAMGVEAVLEDLGWADAAKGRDPLQVRLAVYGRLYVVASYGIV